jgi:N-acetylglutamate synthase-like GNAT family acetyltransferase
MNGEILIREAKIEDSPQIISLMEQLGYRLTLAEMQERMQVCLSSGINHCLKAELEEKIVGICFFLIHPLCYKKANHCLLEVLVVDEQHRKQGIASKLLSRLENIAKENNCSSISLTSNANRMKEIHNFYYHKNYHNDGNRAQIYLRKEL